MKSRAEAANLRLKFSVSEGKTFSVQRVFTYFLTFPFSSAFSPLGRVQPFPVLDDDYSSDSRSAAGEPTANTNCRPQWLSPLPLQLLLAASVWRTFALAWLMSFILIKLSPQRRQPPLPEKHNLNQLNWTVHGLA